VDAEKGREYMHNGVSIAALIIFAGCPLVAFSLRTYLARYKAEESERAWKIVAKFIV
jgi:hypothetical protein